jgi:hypothetical protein
VIDAWLADSLHRIYPTTLPARSDPQRLLQQVAQSVLTGALLPGLPGLQRYPVRVREPQLPHLLGRPHPDISRPIGLIRLVRRDTGATPKTTLFLPDGQEVSVNPSTKAVSVDRYYTFGGVTIGMRTNRGGVRFLFADLNGTNQIAVSTDTWTVTRRYLDPYGNLLANIPTAPEARPTRQKRHRPAPTDDDYDEFQSSDDEYEQLPIELDSDTEEPPSKRPRESADAIDQDGDTDDKK